MNKIKLSEILHDIEMEKECAPQSKQVLTQNEIFQLIEKKRKNTNEPSKQ